MSKIVITGHYGLLGSRFAKHLITKGHKVVGVDNLSGGLPENQTDGVKDYFFDLLDNSKLDELFESEA